MNKKTELQKVSEETMRFMRGKYIADEIGDGNDTLRFRRGGKTILTIYIRDDRYDFHVIFGKAEREKFENVRHEFSQELQDIYDNSTTYDDGKWMLISIDNPEKLNSVKQLVQIKKKPNRKPFPTTHKLIGKCGHRCDLCIHYTGQSSISDDLLEYSWELIKQLYGGEGERALNCDGCDSKECDHSFCVQHDGVKSKCVSCNNSNHCITAAVGWAPTIHTDKITADQVTWAILPYVYEQYGN